MGTVEKHTHGHIEITPHDGKFLLTADRSATDIEGLGLAYKRADAVLWAAAPGMLRALGELKVALESTGPIIGNASGMDLRGSMLEMTTAAIAKTEA